MSMYVHVYKKTHDNFMQQGLYVALPSTFFKP